MLAEQTGGIATGGGADDGLMAAIGRVDGAHAVILGGGALPVICALIRGGALAATEVGLNERSVPEQAELAVAPRIATLADAARAVALAGRAVLPCGRVVIRDVTGAFACEIRGMLRGLGFADDRVAGSECGAIITAERPMFGAIRGYGRA